MFCDTKVDAIVNSSATSEVVVAKDVAMDAITVVNLPLTPVVEEKRFQDFKTWIDSAPWHGPRVRVFRVRQKITASHPTFMF
jgi:hypothetical protein